jgi:multiple sugar transport system permease protein
MVNPLSAAFPRVKKRSSKQQRVEALQGFLFILPWIIGFLVFAAGPVIASLAISFCKWDILTPIEFVGFKNYAKMAQDPLIRKSLVNTMYYASAAIPLGMVGALSTALLLNQKLRAMRLFRTLFYVPSVTAGVATFLLWTWIFNPEYGLLNRALRHQVPWLDLSRGLAFKHVPFIADPPGWLASPDWAMPALIIMALWGVGGGMIIYLAGLQGIPEELYEAAVLDGAGTWQKFWYVTIPMLSPTIFFNLIMSVIGSFQVFGAAYVMTGGGPSNATLFYVLYLFQNAFMYFRMGYSSAMAWLLFIIILTLTLIQFKIAPKWVHYQ